MAQDESCKNAEAPFDGEEGDITIRTSDGVDFYVYKVILSLASPLFKQMFTLKQSPNMENTKEPIPIEESAATLDAILRWCYPISPPVIEDIALFGPILRAVTKYEMVEVTNRARQAFRKVIKDRPLYAYALSCRLDLENEAEEAAKLWKATRLQWTDDSTDFGLTCAGTSFSVDIGGISGGAYFRLLAYLRGGRVLRFCSSGDEGPVSDDQSACSPEALNATYPFTLPDTDLVIQSYDGTEFRVHKLLITLHVDSNAANASHSLLDVSDSTADRVARVRAKEDGRTLAELLSAIPRSPVVIRAAQDYGLSSIVRTYRSQFKRHLEGSPLDLYCIAASLGWADEARLAAETLATDTVEAIGYTSLLESIRAADYHRLLRFCHNYRRTVMTKMGIATYQGWTDVTQWKEQWFTPVAGRSTRMIPSILVEREVTAAHSRRLQYPSGKFNLREVIKLSQEMEADVRRAVSQVEL